MCASLTRDATFLADVSKQRCPALIERQVRVRIFELKMIHESQEHAPTAQAVYVVLIEHGTGMLAAIDACLVGGVMLGKHRIAGIATNGEHDRTRLFQQCSPLL